MTTVLNPPEAPDDLDFTHAFDGVAKASLPQEPRNAQERQEVTAGAAELRREGYYVNVARRAQKVAALPPGGRHSVLCIDDDTALLGILAKKLGLDGYAVRRASDRREIVDELKRPDLPHLILLDVGMPGLTGFDLLLKIRKHPKLASIPVIMLTAHASPENVLHGLASGADGYVSKPFQFDTLSAAMERVLGVR